jgi:hypothetical protein
LIGTANSSLVTRTGATALVVAGVRAPPFAPPIAGSDPSPLSSFEHAASKTKLRSRKIPVCNNERRFMRSPSRFFSA